MCSVEYRVACVCSRILCAMLLEISLYTGERFYVHCMNRCNLTQEMRGIVGFAVDVIDSDGQCNVAGRGPIAE